ncbi:MAG: hypothetical protein ACKOI2_08275 [Actinomycetota bacterium]
MPSVTIDDLHNECQSMVVGPLIFDEIEKAHEIVYRKVAGRMIRDGFDEDEAASSTMTFLVTEPASRAMSPVRKLLILDYLEMKNLGIPMQLNVFRKALRTTIYRHLLSLHPQGYVENLVDRAVEELSRPPFLRVTWAKSFRYFRASTYTETSQNSDLPGKDDLSRAVAAAAMIEKLPQRQRNDANSDPYAEVRLSKVYAAPEFSAILTIMIDFADGLSKTQIFEFFQQLLTNYSDATLLPDMKQDDDERPGSSPGQDHPHSDVDVLRAAAAADETWKMMTASQRVIFRMKAEGVPDLVIAKSPVLAAHNDGTTVSRVTVLNMRSEMQQIIKDGLGELEESEQEFAWDLLLGKAYADAN